MSNYKLVFKHFSSLIGAEYIASEFALGGIEKIVRKYKVKSVFEFGIGIGTIPYLIKKIDSSILYAGTEKNEFCIKEFHKNLNELIDNKFIHLNGSDSSFIDNKFDLVIIDGLFDKPEDLKNLVHEKTILFLEGDRKIQKDLILKLFPDALCARSITLTKNHQWANNKTGYQGGYTVFWLNHKSVKNQTSYFFTKLRTSLYYRLRGFKK